jgi:MHS family proline/betaine transporter-like MFS transporter
MTVQTATAPHEAHSTSYMVRVIAAASIGNALEWFDLLIYGYFAVTLSKLFFPAGSDFVALMLTFGTFAVAYLVRPLGAIFIGAYADSHGRKAALMLSILLMMIGTAIMVVVPTYATIGVAAPIAVLLARLLQGFSVGGEFGSSTAFLVEHSATRKGFLASWQWSSQGVAAILASAFGVLLFGALSQQQVESWGWRLPFVFGLLIGPIGLYIRSNLEEAPEFATVERSEAPLRELVVNQWQRMLLSIGAVVLSTSSNYVILYMPTYGIKELGLPQSVGFTATLMGAIILTVVSPFVGHWSDKAGRTGIMMAMCVLFAVSAYPAFVGLVHYPSLLSIVLIVGWMSLLKAGYSGVLPSLMAEIFPIRTRASGLSLSYNIGVPLFGGAAPLYMTALIELTGNNLMPSFYLIVTALVSLAVLVAIRTSLRLR